jgi:uncharacterized pyridoxamine 5'-phosphate oxidase family protein
MAFLLENIITYLKNNKSIVLASVDGDNLPDLRTIGGYNFDGLTLYFATAKTSKKVEQLLHNDKVAILVQHENQVLPNYTNLTIYGRARKLIGAEYERGRAKLLERRPNAIYEEDSKNIYQVAPEQIKILDLSKKANEQIQIIKP